MPSGINDPFASKVLLVVGDMAQLPPICNHFVESPDNVCDLYVILKKNHFRDLTLILHRQHQFNMLKIFEYLQVLNIILIKIPLETKIEHYLAPCIIPNDQNLLTNFNEQTTILCSHKIDLINLMT
jgi:hypothetical protein